MSQDTVLQFLREHPNKWYSASQIQPHLNQKLASVTMNLQKLRFQRAVLFEMKKYYKGKDKYYYKHKE